MSKIVGRRDLSNWVIHFVHSRNLTNQDAASSFNFEDDHYIIPDGFTYDGKPVYLSSKDEEDDYGLSEEADAFEVLKKILHDGIIKAGWSFRNGKPTIYGSKAAACFTEMPLYALMEYAKSRNAEGYVAPYGIAFLKEELFRAGARPVIYGLSISHKEAKKADPNFGIGLRSLATSSGLGNKEMYRYVYTSLGKEKNISWMHEREWRWADIREHFEFPGLPFYAINDTIKFSRIIIIVKTKKESEKIIQHLIHLTHSKATNFAREYDLRLIERSYVLAIDALDGLFADPLNITLDELPLARIPKLPKILVSFTVMQKVKEAIAEADRICYEATKADFEKHGDYDISGFCSIVTYVPKSEITQALIDMERAYSYGKGYYSISLKTYPCQGLGTQEIGCRAAAEYLTQALVQSFTVNSRWD